MMPYFLRHYSTFADRIILWDEQSTDGTREIINSFPKAELREWPHKGLDDDRFLEAVNNWYKIAIGKAEWVMWPDIDEILYHDDPIKVVQEAKGDMLPATGYAMISEGVPALPEGQIYDTVRMGCRQKNYDKSIIWRSDVDVQHTHGRHAYGMEWPKCSGRRYDWVPRFKLLHYHYFGVNYTKERNQRNYDRACNKRFAWNYDQSHNRDPNQSGSVEWVRKLMDNNHLFDVLKHDSTRIHH